MVPSFCSLSLSLSLVFLSSRTRLIAVSLLLLPSFLVPLPHLELEKFADLGMQQLEKLHDTRFVEDRSCRSKVMPQLFLSHHHHHHHKIICYSIYLITVLISAAAAIASKAIVTTRR